VILGTHTVAVFTFLACSLSWKAHVAIALRVQVSREQVATRVEVMSCKDLKDFDIASASCSSLCRILRSRLSRTVQRLIRLGRRQPWQI